MKYKSIAAIAAFATAPFMGMAQEVDAGSEDWAKNLRPSVNLVYSVSTEDNNGLYKDAPVLYGVDFRLSYFLDNEKKEVFAGLAYLMGTNDMKAVNDEIEAYRFELFGGMNFWVPMSESVDVYAGARLGLAQQTLYLDSNKTRGTNTAFFGALGCGFAWKISEEARLRVGVEYNTYIHSLGNDVYEDQAFASNVAGTVGIEWSF